jgi:hypothetical protein
MCGLVHQKRRFDRLQQSRVSEWFESALHGMLGEQAWTDGELSVTRSKSRITSWLRRFISSIDDTFV